MKRTLSKHGTFFPFFFILMSNKSQNNLNKVLVDFAALSSQLNTSRIWQKSYISISHLTLVIRLLRIFSDARRLQISPTNTSKNDFCHIIIDSKYVNCGTLISRQRLPVPTDTEPTNFVRSSSANRAEESLFESGKI